ncbi:MAG: LLM class flavin-dependent oxidoreductase [Dehalococcoidia bacterium]|nr:LLM class flavin-dependent oxidoreductase [Dehalococcoidia bacterium]
MRKITVGVNWQGPLDRDAMLRDAKAADESGVHMITVAEAWGRDAITLLALLAYETRNVQLGTSIINSFSRTPAAIAQHFTTLDQVSNGRMMIGLGTSGPLVIEHFHGIPFDKPITRLREYVEIINMLVAGEPLHYHGKIFELDRGFSLRHLGDLPRRHIPIYLGSQGPVSVALAAELADGWLAPAAGREGWKQQVADFRSKVASYGRDPDSVVITAGGAHVTAEPEKAYQFVREQTAFYMAKMGELHYQNFHRIGLGEVADEVRRVWREEGSQAAYAAVTDDVVHARAYAGPVEGAIEWVEAQREAGYSQSSVAISERDPQKRAEIYRKLVG